MTNQDIINLAAEFDLVTFGPQDLIFFAREIEARSAAAEREECAKVAAEWQDDVMSEKYQCDVASAIRARGRHD